MLLPRCSLPVLLSAVLAMGCNAAVVSGWSDDPLYEDPSGDGPDDVPVDRAPRDPARPSSEEIFFRPDVQRDLADEGCIFCHQRAGTPMQITAEPDTDAEWRDNYEEVAARAGGLLVGKATGDGGHGAFLDASSPVLAHWRAWIDAGTPFESEASPEPEPTEEDASVPEADAGTTTPPTGGASVTYSTDVQPIIETNGCTRCHDPGPSRAGGYDLSDFAGIMAAGSDDVPNVIPGDADSVLVDYARNGHQGIGYLEALTIMDWVVEWEARRD